MSVEKWRKTGSLQSRQQFVCESGRILPRIGDEDLEFFPCARFGHELLPDLNAAISHQPPPAGQRDELAPRDHSITSSARTINVIGTWSPIALAALRLRISSNFVGCSTGRLEGLAPRRILST